MTNEIFFCYYLKNKNKFKLLTHPQKSFLYFSDHRINLLSGEKEDIKLDFFLAHLKTIKLEDNLEKPQVFILFYELGYLFNQLSMPADCPLAIELEFCQQQLIAPKDFETQFNFTDAHVESFTSYAPKFDEIQQNLSDGISYQVNLTVNETRSHHYRAQDFFDKFLSISDNLSAYAHLLNIPSLNLMYLSNSPECLFQLRQSSNKYEIYSMPIKGTVKVGRSKSLAWSELKNSAKNTSELFMIADLIRNDLSKIDVPNTKIIHTKKRLDVPKLVHQYSLLSSVVSKKINLFKIISAVFPGGSITGAPKRSSMQIIHKMEKRLRGFYCGSTIICDGLQKAGSINIRSSEIDFTNGKISYGSGGGVTIKSEKYDEYNEILHKTASFFSIFQ